MVFFAGVGVKWKQNENEKKIYVYKVEYSLELILHLDQRRDIHCSRNYEQILL